VRAQRLRLAGACHPTQHPGDDAERRRADEQREVGGQPLEDQVADRPKRRLTGRAEIEVPERAPEVVDQLGRERPRIEEGLGPQHVQRHERDRADEYRDHHRRPQPASGERQVRAGHARGW
jgi:hypothetical protein